MGQVLKKTLAFPRNQAASRVLTTLWPVCCPYGQALKSAPSGRFFFAFGAM